MAFLMAVLMWALLGWSGVVWPPTLPPPPPPPDRRYFLYKLFNTIGAVIGGLVWNWTWPIAAQNSPGLGAAASCIGAVIGAALVSDLARMLFKDGGKA